MTAQMYGADADELDRLAVAFNSVADDLDREAGTLSGFLNNISWLGDVAIRFSNRWAGTSIPQLRLSTRFLREAAEQLARNAADQRRVSGESIGGVWRDGAIQMPAGIMPGGFGSLASSDAPQSGWQFGPSGRWVGGSDGLFDRDAHNLWERDAARQYRYERGEWSGQPGRWPGIEPDLEAFLGLRADGEHGHYLWRDQDGRRQGDFFAGERHEGQAGATFNRHEGFLGAEGKIAAGLFGSAALLAGGRYASAALGAEGFVGARAKAGASVGYDWRRGEAHANAGVDAFAGAEAGAHAQAELAGVGAKAGVSGYAGIGAKAEADIRYDDGTFKTRVELGAALGLGVGTEFEISVDVGKVADTIKKYNPFD